MDVETYLGSNAAFPIEIDSAAITEFKQKEMIIGINRGEPCMSQSDRQSLYHAMILPINSGFSAFSSTKKSKKDYEKNFESVFSSEQVYQNHSNGTRLQDALGTYLHQNFESISNINEYPAIVCESLMIPDNTKEKINSTDPSSLPRIDSNSPLLPPSFLPLMYQHMNEVYSPLLNEDSAKINDWEFIAASAELNNDYIFGSTRNHSVDRMNEANNQPTNGGDLTSDACGQNREELFAQDLTQPWSHQKPSEELGDPATLNSFFPLENFIASPQFNINASNICSPILSAELIIRQSEINYPDLSQFSTIASDSSCPIFSSPSASLSKSADKFKNASSFDHSAASYLPMETLFPSQKPQPQDPISNVSSIPSGCSSVHSTAHTTPNQNSSHSNPLAGISPSDLIKLQFEFPAQFFSNPRHHIPKETSPQSDPGHLSEKYTLSATHYEEQTKANFEQKSSKCCLYPDNLNTLHELSDDSLFIQNTDNHAINLCRAFDSIQGNTRLSSSSPFLSNPFIRQYSSDLPLEFSPLHLSSPTVDKDSNTAVNNQDHSILKMHSLCAIPFPSYSIPLETTSSSSSVSSSLSQISNPDVTSSHISFISPFESSFSTVQPIRQNSPIITNMRASNSFQNDSGKTEGISKPTWLSHKKARRRCTTFPSLARPIETELHNASIIETQGCLSLNVFRDDATEFGQKNEPTLDSGINLSAAISRDAICLTSSSSEDECIDIPYLRTPENLSKCDKIAELSRKNRFRTCSAAEYLIAIRTQQQHSNQKMSSKVSKCNKKISSTGPSSKIKIVQRKTNQILETTVHHRRVSHAVDSKDGQSFAATELEARESLTTSTVYVTRRSTSSRKSQVIKNPDLINKNRPSKSLKSDSNGNKLDPSKLKKQNSSRLVRNKFGNSLPTATLAVENPSNTLRQSSIRSTPDSGDCTWSKLQSSRNFSRTSCILKDGSKKNESILQAMTHKKSISLPETDLGNFDENVLLARIVPSMHPQNAKEIVPMGLNHDLPSSPTTCGESNRPSERSTLHRAVKTSPMLLPNSIGDMTGHEFDSAKESQSNISLRRKNKSLNGEAKPRKAGPNYPSPTRKSRSCVKLPINTSSGQRIHHHDLINGPESKDFTSGSKVARICFNCGTSKTASWRRSKLHFNSDDHNEGSFISKCYYSSSLNGVFLCNPCGLYEKLHKVDRPLEKLESGEMKIVRGKRSGGICSNCGATETPAWRRGINNESLCNACGLYLRTHYIRKRNSESDAEKDNNHHEQLSSDFSPDACTIIKQPNLSQGVNHKSPIQKNMMRKRNRNAREDSPSPSEYGIDSPASPSSNAGTPSTSAASAEIDFSSNLNSHSTLPTDTHNGLAPSPLPNLTTTGMGSSFSRHSNGPGIVRDYENPKFLEEFHPYPKHQTHPFKAIHISKKRKKYQDQKITGNAP